MLDREGYGRIVVGPREQVHQGLWYRVVLAHNLDVISAEGVEGREPGDWKELDRKSDPDDQSIPPLSLKSSRAKVCRSTELFACIFVA